METAQTVQNLQLNNNALFAYLELAKDLNVPREAISNFQIGGYVAQEKQLKFHAAARSCDFENGPTQVGFGGARGPGKSHALFAQAALDDCQRIEGLKVLYLRKVGKNAREQFEDLRRSVLKYTPHDFSSFKGVLTFPNQSFIIIGHFRNESDIDNYLGLEYDLIIIEEATTLTEAKYKALRDSNRTSKEGWRPRIYCSTNPGNIGHAWFKKRFIVPARDGVETDTRFIFATVTDNEFIDKTYKAKLEENTGWKLRAYRYGDWDIAAGQFFTNWNHDLIVKTIEPPKYQRYWASMDYGYTHPTVVYLFTEFDGTILVVDEFRARKQLPDQNAREIIQMFQRNGVEMWQLETFVAGRDVFAQKGDSEGKTIAEQYEEAGIKLEPANDDRINGWAELAKRIGDPLRAENPLPPTISISKKCVHLIQCIPTLQHNPNKPEDVLKMDVDDEGENGDDEGDSLRYGVMAHKAMTASSGYETGVPYGGK